MTKLMPLAAMMMAATATPLAAQDLPAPNAQLLQGTLLDVTAEGKVTRTPDLATIGVGVQTQAATAQAAMAENASRMASLIAALKRAGVADKDIQTSAVSLSAQFSYPDKKPPVLTGYQANNRLNVRFRDIARTGAILDALVAAGANQIDGPSLSLADADAAMDAARQDAMARARARAELYARAAGLRVDRIVMIAEGGLPTPGPVPVYAMAKASFADAATSISPGEQDITATVSVRFLLR